MITKTATMTVGHEMILRAVQEYLERQFREGQCPQVTAILQTVSGIPEDRTFTLSLFPPGTQAAVQPVEAVTERRSRRLDIAAS